MPEVKTSRNYLREQLREIPAFRALIRAIESRFFDELAPLPKPVLDLGCGDGQFAQSTFQATLAAGIDIDRPALREAKEHGAYHLVSAASAIALPFREGTFGSVIANCSIEHIPDVESVIAEVSRVLTPGGVFVLSVPSHRYGDFLLGSSLMREMKLPGASRAYADWFNHHSQHFTLDSPQGWTERLRRHGIGVEEWRYYLSRQAMQAFDLAHYLSLPSLISRKTTGKWVLFPDLITRRLFEKWFEKHYSEPLAPGEEGGCIFLIARKI